MEKGKATSVFLFKVIKKICEIEKSQKNESTILKLETAPSIRKCRLQILSKNSQGVTTTFFTDEIDKELALYIFNFFQFD